MKGGIMSTVTKSQGTVIILYICGLIMLVTLFVSPPVFAVLLFVLVYYGLNKAYDTHKKGNKVDSKSIAVSSITTIIPCVIGGAIITFIVGILYLLYCLLGQFLFFVI